jgi:pyruvate kinase
MKNEVNIICTMGPACQHISVLRQMAEEGMNVVRLNFSHGTHVEHAKFVKTVEALQKEGYNIKILLDLEGYQIRIGNLGPDGGIQINEGQTVYLAKNPDKLDRRCVIPLEYASSFHDILVGVDIYIDDGHILLKSVKTHDDYIKSKVIVPGFLKTNKGVNIPEIKLKFDVFTPKDQRDILFGIEHQVDYIAQSFVRNSDDVKLVLNFLKEQKHECKVIAKIENREGIDNIKAIMNVADGIMIARGDMGVSIPIYQVPIIQKVITRHCNEAGKMVITATQMLESMTHSARPTRAEVADVANAVLDGTNSVMLSGETAIGSYPVNVVRMMKSIVEYTKQERNQVL